MLSRILSIIIFSFFHMVTIWSLPACAQQQEQTGPETLELPLKGVPLAVFTTPGTLWLVAGGTVALPSEVFKITTPMITGVKQLPSQQATILQFALSGAYYAAIDKPSDTGIRITLQRNAVPPFASLPLSVQTGALKEHTLHIDAQGAQSVFTVRDPQTDREFDIIPLASAGSAVYPERSFPQFDILQSAQGIVVQKSADEVKIAVHNGNVEISAPSGLKISDEVAENLNGLSDTANMSDASTLFPYAAWKLDDNKNFVPTQIKLFHDIAFNPPEAANNARLKLLGIYLGQGLFSEALGMANDILRVSYKFYRAHNVAALRGAAYFFMQHFEDARRDFSSPELANNNEIAMWLALCAELQGESQANFVFSDNFDRYISKYPPSFIQKIAITAADLDISRKDYGAASAIFSIVTKASLDEPIQKYIDYMRAKIFSETNNEEEAEKIWEKQAEMIEDPLIRASADFSLVNMLIREDKITPQQAIKKLEKLRIVWRGDNLELSILTLLGNLYVDEKQYSQALHTLREIVLYYPHSPQTIATAQKMAEIFKNLYNKGVADTMPPLEALTLFYEFRDLVPTGKEGDMMIRNLADRLVGIDLLDRAEMLLNHQVQKRLQGYERSRVGAHLASIYLENHQPKDALDTLKTTGYGTLPPDLQLMRLRLTARALAQQGHSDKSIEVLSNDNTPEGTLLRLAIYWENKDWPNVTLTAEEILSNRSDPSAPLTKEESGVLLKLATAYVFEHDNGQIQYLRDYFTPLLKGNPDKESFLFITSQSSTLDYSSIANLDTDIGNVKAFLENVKKTDKTTAVK